MFPIDDQKDIELYTSTIRNFLNYVLHHRVCEEYTSDVLAARKVCSLAEKELWAIKQLEKKLPGDFNIAASTLHGGRYENLHMGTAPWAVESPEYQEYAAADQGLEVRDAEMIFKTAIAFAGDDDMFIEAMKADIHIVKTTTRCFEVAGIERPDLLTASQYKSVPHVRGIKALGVLKLKHWEGPKIIPEDFTDDEDDQTNKSDAIESFWLEDDILQLCYIGLKMEIEVHELNIGVKFFDRLHGLYCSFFVALPNEKMLGYKESGKTSFPETQKTLG
ncbi:uncharacterized protein LY89DRAFT_685221 [Mollisia scopiformis]|uniref:Uncharacterized protein n=1 Tax=Mollisia scopiformis TaxID=149040 RepID=A0A194X7V5_MOLSC|nr:uncharacterized protein LY89DRAFT_685221 [Mollisia scopiformis]KUJ16184.1 hypothetical protein LY89DRAFT_685221 [Mollisia scopiformis]